MPLGRALCSCATAKSFCYPEGCAAPGDVRCQCNTRGLLSKLEKIPPQRKIHVTSKSPVGDISDVTLIRTDTTLDHSQKAEKVCHENGVAAYCPNSDTIRACVRGGCPDTFFGPKHEHPPNMKEFSFRKLNFVPLPYGIPNNCTE